LHKAFRDAVYHDDSSAAAPSGEWAGILTDAFVAATCSGFDFSRTSSIPSG